jgi:hydroxymethylpyrimidine pyrophosphatase-like HAD family hydrolase
VRHFPWLIKPDNDVYDFKVWRVAKIEDFEAHIEELRAFFENTSETVYEGKVLKCKVITSGKGSHRYIDVAHHDGGKHAGVRYAQRRFHFSPAKTLVAGDSGNDIDMFIGEELGVVVGNHEPELAAFLDEGQAVNKYISRENYADAIIEAIGRLTKRA